MKILDRYLTGQVVGSVIWSVSVISLMLVLGNAMRELLTVLMSHQLPLSYVLSIFGYLLPFSMIYSIPWGILVAVLLVFGKLSSDNELVALRANGIGILRICAPVFVIALIFFGICLWINLYMAPIAQVQLKSAVFKLASQDPLALFGSDEVIDQFPNRRIYVGRKNGSTLEDLHIFELNAQQMPMRVVYARRGQLEVDKENERILLHIYDARYEERDNAAPDDLKRMRYGITLREGVMPISLQDLIQKATSNQRPNQLTLGQLRDAIEQQTGKAGVGLRTEMSKRFSNSMAVITFILVGIPLAITAQRRETSVGIAMSLIVAFTYFIFIVITDNVKNNPHLHPEILIWFPNFLYLALGGVLFYRLANR
ncbi:MAG: LptF/LptG family permease [Verrucomicrobia bacterium]|nr:LptF/LptG family permease [Verrucomicrobiota bacterium]